MGIRKILIYLAATLTVSTALAVLVAYLVLSYYRHRWEAQAFDDRASRTWAPAVAADLKSLGDDPFFAALLAREHLQDVSLDAGTYLNRRIVWQLPDGDQPPVAAGLELPRGPAAQVEGAGRDWLEHGAEVDLSGVDFSWFAHLAPFQYWDLEATGTLADVLAKQADVDLMNAPSPELGPLNMWVKLRLISALKAADPAVALRDVERLATLALTTQSTVHMMVGLSYLSQVDRTAAYLKTRGVTLPAGVPAVAAAQVLRARRAAWALGGFVDLGVAPASVDLVLPTAAVRFGACASLDERLPALQMTRLLLEPFYPERYSALDQLVSRLAAGCRPHVAIKQWRNPSYVPMPLRGNLLALADLADVGARLGRTVQEGGGVTLVQVRQVPVFGQALGLILASVSRPELFGPYEEESGRGEAGAAGQP